MKEYGGYIELDRYSLPMLHEQALLLNCGRNCLGYLIKARNIKKLKLPYFICDSVTGLCEKYGVSVQFYHIGEDFQPEEVRLDTDEWLYVVNYYGQLTNARLKALKERYQRVIIDNAQAYFEAPLPETDTLYTCRKFFGVADGGILYTNAHLQEELEQDISFERMNFLLGRFEKTASEFYNEYVANNHAFADEPIKKMSKLTKNLLHGIDYEKIKKQRTENFSAYHEKLKNKNKLNLQISEGAFAYPLWLENGAEVRKALQKQKIYIPMLWPSVLNLDGSDATERSFAENILPLPVDQRYSAEDTKIILNTLTNFI